MVSLRLRRKYNCMQEVSTFSIIPEAEGGEE
jgi:hypothetical protein